MIHLLTIQGFKARKYHLPIEFLGDFKSMVHSVLGQNVFIVSNKFKTDIFYESPFHQNDSVIKLWKMYVKKNLNAEELHQIRTYSGNEEVLVQYFNSLAVFARNHFLFCLYQKSFRKAFYSDPLNKLVNKLIACDRHIIAQYQSKGSAAPREALVAIQNATYLHHVAFTKWTRLKNKIKRFEN